MNSEKVVYITPDKQFRVVRTAIGYAIQQLVETGEYWHVTTTDGLSQARKLIGPEK